MNDGDIRKIVVKQCYDCKGIVFKPHRGEYCHHPEVSITKIENPREIPNFCPLDADIPVQKITMDEKLDKLRTDELKEFTRWYIKKGRADKDRD